MSIWSIHVQIMLFHYLEPIGSMCQFQIRSFSCSKLEGGASQRGEAQFARILHEKTSMLVANVLLVQIEGNLYHVNPQRLLNKWGNFVVRVCSLSPETTEEHSEHR